MLASLAFMKVLLYILYMNQTYMLMNLSMLYQRSML